MENGLFTGLSYGTFDNSLFMIRKAAINDECLKIKKSYNFIIKDDNLIIRLHNHVI